MKRAYGATPVHLVGHLLLLLLTGYAVVQIFALDNTGKILAWLAAAVLLHDAVLWPLYTGADRAGQALGARVNYVRVPLGLSLLLALVFLSTVSGRGEATYSHASGRGWDGYVMRWLVASAVLFLVSGLVYAVRARR